MVYNFLSDLIKKSVQKWEKNLSKNKKELEDKIIYHKKIKETYDQQRWLTLGKDDSDSHPKVDSTGNLSKSPTVTTMCLWSSCEEWRMCWCNLAFTADCA